MRKVNERHGHCSNRGTTKTYAAWRGMKDRCSNKNNPAFHNYGGRGVTVCSRWMIFENFLADMGEAPPAMSLERKDNNKGYCKNNCKWASVVEQGNNRRTNKLIAIGGQLKTIAEWERVFGIAKGRACARLNRGWSIENAFTNKRFKTGPKARV